MAYLVSWKGAMGDPSRLQETLIGSSPVTWHCTVTSDPLRACSTLAIPDTWGLSGMKQTRCKL